MTRHFLLPLLVLASGVVVCLVIAWFAAGFSMSWPELAAQLGEPYPGLESLEKAYLRLRLVLRSEDLNSASGDPDLEIEFSVDEGESADVVVGRLQSVGLVEDGQLLLDYMRYRGFDRGIEVGSHLISGSMTPRDIADQLQSAASLDIRVTIPEGWRMEQTAAKLASELQISETVLLEEMRKRPEGYFFSDFLPLDATCEGFLFPDTYSFSPGTSASEAVAAMLSNFEARLTEELVVGFLAQEISIYEAVVLASIIEREAVVSDERPQIAGVFLNRLDRQMKLETDPTVQYAVGQQADGRWWKQQLTYDDLAFVSPYNTYVADGLPPGPICSPGMESLQAAADPEDTPFLFFRARCDGSGRHFFAVTYEEHLQNACSP